MTALGEHLPWYAFVAPGVVGLWDGGLMRCYRFRGPDVSSLGKAERVQLNERISQALRAIGEQMPWHIESPNVEVAGYPNAEWPTTASAIVDAERKEMCLAAGAQYEMQHYLCLTQVPPASGAEAVSRLLVGGAGERFEEKTLTDFIRSTDEITAQLRGLVRIESLDDDATAAMLRNAASTRRQRYVRASDHEILSETLCDERFVRGLGLSRLGDNFIAVLTLGGFPEHAFPQALAELSRLPFEFRWSIRCLPISRFRAKKLMETRESKALGSSQYFKDLALAKLTGGQASGERKDREQLRLAEEAGSELERLSSRGYGYMTTTFVVWDRKSRVCDAKRAKLRTALNDVGLVVRYETLESVKPWLMSLPGNRRVGRRTHPMRLRNITDLMPTSSVWQGKPYDAQLARTTGVKQPWMHTADPIPLDITTDVPGGGAHTLLLGATGQAAKSTFANLMGLQFFRWPNAQVVSVGIGKSEIGPCVLSGGTVYSIGERDGTPFQPLAFVDQPDEARAALEWLELCLEAVGQPATPADRDALGEMLGVVAHRAPRQRTLTEFVERMLKTRAPHLALALKPYTHAGHYGHVFDGDDAEALKRRRWTMFDLAPLLEMRDVALVPAIAHLVHRISRWFDGRPTLLTMEEFPQWMHHEPLSRLATWVLDTQRKDNVRALMIAQTPGQLLQPKHARLLASIMSGCATKIYGPDAEAMTMLSSYAELGVTRAEVEQIAGMALGSYLIKNPGGSRKFAMNSGPLALSLAGTDDRTLFAELAAKCSTPDAALWKFLETKRLTARAKRLLGCKENEIYHALADAAQ